MASGSVTGGVVIGTGAFNSVEASRRLSVEVAHDNEAYLGLRQLGAGTRSFEHQTPEKVEFSIPGLFERIDDPELGLGKDSVYEFVYDSDEDDTRGLLRITNQGTNEVVVCTEHNSQSELEIETFDVTDPTRTALRVEPVELSPGEYVDVGFRIETFGAQNGLYEETLTIIAELPADGS